MPCYVRMPVTGMAGTVILWMSFILCMVAVLVLAIVMLADSELLDRHDAQVVFSRPCADFLYGPVGVFLAGGLRQDTSGHFTVHVYPRTTEYGQVNRPSSAWTMDEIQICTAYGVPLNAGDVTCATSDFDVPKRIPIPINEACTIPRQTGGVTGDTAMRIDGLEYDYPSSAVASLFTSPPLMSDGNIDLAGAQLYLKTKDAGGSFAYYPLHGTRIAV